MCILCRPDVLYLVECRWFKILTWRVTRQTICTPHPFSAWRFGIDFSRLYQSKGTSILDQLGFPSNIIRFVLLWEHVPWRLLIFFAYNPFAEVPKRYTISLTVGSKSGLTRSERPTLSDPLTSSCPLVRLTICSVRGQQTSSLHGGIAVEGALKDYSTNKPLVGIILGMLR